MCTTCGIDVCQLCADKIGEVRGGIDGHRVELLRTILARQPQWHWPADLVVPDATVNHVCTSAECDQPYEVWAEGLTVSYHSLLTSPDESDIKLN